MALRVKVVVQIDAREHSVVGLFFQLYILQVSGTCGKTWRSSVTERKLVVTRTWRITAVLVVDDERKWTCMKLFFLHRVLKNVNKSGEPQKRRKGCLRFFM